MDEVKGDEVRHLEGRFECLPSSVRLDEAEEKQLLEILLAAC